MKAIFLKTIVAAFMILICAGTQAAKAEDVPDCLKDVKVGEWVKYKMQGGMEMKQTVAKVTEKEVTLSKEMFMDGKALGKPNETKIPRKAEGDASGEGEKPKTSSATVKVKGKDVKCVVIEASGSKTYMSNDIPVTGIVKSEAGGKVTMELIDYGTK